jgi:hypothetical protein
MGFCDQVLTITYMVNRGGPLAGATAPFPTALAIGLT